MSSQAETFHNNMGRAVDLAQRLARVPFSGWATMWHGNTGAFIPIADVEFYTTDGRTLRTIFAVFEDSPRFSEGVARSLVKAVLR
jgi:hypothetical protein